MDKIMAIILNKNSLLKLKGVHPSLVKITELAAQKSDVKFIITCGVRAYAEQVRLYNAGFTQTKKSMHLKQLDGFSHAVDFCPLNKEGLPDWLAIKDFYHIADCFKESAKELNHKITWGGDWKNAWDKPHIQIEL
jgi:peptidoglycan L-alanyl-D-glutamate endopeptidase CwlK